MEGTVRYREPRLLLELVAAAHAAGEITQELREELDGWLLDADALLADLGVHAGREG